LGSSLRAFGDEEAFDCVLDEHWKFRLQNVMIRVSLRIGNVKNLKILIFVFLYVLHRQHIVEHCDERVTLVNVDFQTSA
jgi:hypothetical protein